LYFLYLFYNVFIYLISFIIFVVQGSSSMSETNSEEQLYFVVSDRCQQYETTILSFVVCSQRVWFIEVSGYLSTYVVTELELIQIPY
jgi:hypothetical protein